MATDEVTWPKSWEEANAQSLQNWQNKTPWGRPSYFHGLFPSETVVLAPFGGGHWQLHTELGVPQDSCIRAFREQDDPFPTRSQIEEMIVQWRLTR